jgi:hypothetical protein
MAAGTGSRLALAARAAGLLVLALFVALLFYGLATKAPRKGIDTHLSEGRAASPPDLDLPVLTRAGPGPWESRLRAAFADGSVSTSEFRGRPVVLSSDARNFVADQEVTYPSLRDGSGDTARAWGVSGLPETFFIRPDGRVVAHGIGEISAAQLRRGVQAARRGEVTGSLRGGDLQSTR